MIDDYGYLNARVRGLKGLLLTGRDVEAALAAASLEEFIAFLGSTPYAAAVAEALTRHQGDRGGRGGAAPRLPAHHRPRRAHRRRPPRRLLALVLGRWELFNVKTVLRGLHARAGLERVMGSTIPFGRLDEAALQELARQADVKAAIDLLAQWRLPYAPALRRAYPAYRGRSDLHVLETALDRGFFAAALRGLDPGRPDDAVVAGSLRREIDLILLGYALRAMHHGTPPADLDEIFIPGGQTDHARGLRAALRRRHGRGVRGGAAAAPPSPRCLAEGRPARPRAPPPLRARPRPAHLLRPRDDARSVAGDPLSIALRHRVSLAQGQRDHQPAPRRAAGSTPRSPARRSRRSWSRAG